MADKNHTDCGRMFRFHGFQTRSDPTSRFVEQPGRSDYTVTQMIGVNVECKQGGDGVDMTHLRENQREWAEKFSLAEPFCTPYWIFLTIGTDSAMTTMGKLRKIYKKNKPSIYLPKKTWFVPYEKYIEVENKIKPYQSTLPYMIRPGMRREMQDNMLDALTLFKGYELVWNPSNSLLKPAWFSPKTDEKFGYGIWTIPESHPFWQMLRKDLVTRALKIIERHKLIA
jgi:hypothetical protein